MDLAHRIDLRELAVASADEVESMVADLEGRSRVEDPWAEAFAASDKSKTG